MCRAASPKLVGPPSRNIPSGKSSSAKRRSNYTKKITGREGRRGAPPPPVPHPNNNLVVPESKGFETDDTSFTIENEESGIESLSIDEEQNENSALTNPALPPPPPVSADDFSTEFGR